MAALQSSWWLPCHILYRSLELRGSMVSRHDLPHILNLVNSIMGVSLLAMPYCFMKCGMILGTLLLLFSTYLTTVTCELLMRSAIVSKKRSYELLAYHLFGAAGKLAVEIGITGVQLGICIAFHVVIGDLGPKLVSKWTSIQDSDALRFCLMTFLAACVTLPLSLMRNADGLLHVSVVVVGFYAILAFALFITSVPNMLRSDWLFKVQLWQPANAFQCLPIFAMSFGCQTQMFLLYESLPEPSLLLVNGITKCAVNLCTALYFAAGFFGYIAFYDKSLTGDVLLAFDRTLFTDLLMFGFILSVPFSFPVMVFPCRQSLNSLLFSSNQSLHGHSGFAGPVPMSANQSNILTIIIVFGTLCIGLLFPNVELILGLNGSTTGSLICFICPALLYLRSMGTKPDGKQVARVILLIGILILVISTYNTLDSKHRDTSVPHRDTSVPHRLEPITQPAVAALDHKAPLPPHEANRDEVNQQNIADLKDQQVVAGGQEQHLLPEHNDPKTSVDDQRGDNVRKEPPNPEASDELMRIKDHLVNEPPLPTVKEVQEAHVKSARDHQMSEEDKHSEIKEMLKRIQVQQDIQQSLIAQNKELIEAIKEVKKVGDGRALLVLPTHEGDLEKKEQASDIAQPQVAQVLASQQKSETAVTKPSLRPDVTRDTAAVHPPEPAAAIAAQVQGYSLDSQNHLELSVSSNTKKMEELPPQSLGVENIKANNDQVKGAQKERSNESL